MDMSGFDHPEGLFFPALEAGTPLNHRGTDSEVDLWLLEGTVDEDAPDSLLPRIPVFLDRMVWSSLAVVLLLHATLACLLPLLIKQPVDNPPKIIELQLAFLPGGCGQAGGQPTQAGPKAAEGAKSVSPAPPAAVPPPPVQAQKEPPKPHQVAKVDGILPPEPKIQPKVKKRPKKIVRVIQHHEERKEVAAEKPVERAQTEPGKTQSQRLVQSAAAVTPGTGGGGAGKAAGPADRGGTGNRNGPGGSGPSEIAFGSPNGPRFLHQVAPAYPALARRLERQGTVLLRVTIDTRGRPIKVEVLKKAGFGMDEEAVKAVEESTFVPARRGGQPLTCRALLPIRFVLETS